MSEHDLDKKELKHDAVPGFRPVFIVIFVGFVIYMIIIFAFAGWGAAGH